MFSDVLAGSASLSEAMTGQLAMLIFQRLVFSGSEHVHSMDLEHVLQTPQDKCPSTYLKPGVGESLVAK